MRKEQQDQRPTFWQVVLSVLAAAFGVQSQRARERDFTYGNPAAYLIGGAIFTISFILVLVMIVKLVLRANGL